MGKIKTLKFNPAWQRTVWRSHSEHHFPAHLHVSLTYKRKPSALYTAGLLEGKTRQPTTRAKALLHLADSHGQLIHFPAPLSAALKSCWWRGSICGGLYQIHSLHEAQAVLLLQLRAITALTAMVPALCIVFPMVGTTHTHTQVEEIESWGEKSPVADDAGKEKLPRSCVLQAGSETTCKQPPVHRAQDQQQFKLFPDSTALIDQISVVQWCHRQLLSPSRGLIF